MAHLDSLCADLSAKEAGKRKRRRDAQPFFEAAIKAIVLDLYRAHQSDPMLEVGIGTGTTALQQKSKSRYGASFISARTFIDAMEALQSAGLILLSTPHWDDPEKKRSRVARYMATPSLVCGLDRVGATVVDLRRHRNAESIRLKDGDKRLVEYGDHAFANAARDRLRVINDMLEGQWADLARTDDQIAADLNEIAGTRDDEAAQSFDFAARTVHRVFNNEDWGQGGRFYGAWWISCPSGLRPYILINGKRTVEVDYSGLHAAMLYAEHGQTIPDDPYERCVTKAGNKAERKTGQADLQCTPERGHRGPNRRDRRLLSRDHWAKLERLQEAYHWSVSRVPAVLRFGRWATVAAQRQRLGRNCDAEVCGHGLRLPTGA